MNSYAKAYISPKDYHSFADAAPDTARAFVEKADRTRLGVFAVTDEQLTIAITLNIRGASKRNCAGINAHRDAIIRLYEKSEDALLMFGREITNDAVNEAVFWGFHNYYAKYGSEAGLNRLKTIRRHPVEFHPYFRAGIWDTKQIESFISHDIDPELGLRTLLSEI